MQEANPDVPRIRQQCKVLIHVFHNTVHGACVFVFLLQQLCGIPAEVRGKIWLVRARTLSPHHTATTSVYLDVDFCDM